MTKQTTKQILKDFNKFVIENVDCTALIDDDKDPHQTDQIVSVFTTFVGDYKKPFALDNKFLEKNWEIIKITCLLKHLVDGGELEAVWKDGEYSFKATPKAIEYVKNMGKK